MDFAISILLLFTNIISCKVQCVLVASLLNYNYQQDFNWVSIDYSKMNPALAPQKRWSSPKILRSDQYKFRLTASDFLGGGEKLISLLVIPKSISSQEEACWFSYILILFLDEVLSSWLSLTSLTAFHPSSWLMKCTMMLSEKSEKWDTAFSVKEMTLVYSCPTNQRFIVWSANAD